MVVDENPFPLDSSTIERQDDLIIQRAQTAALIEARAYDGELDHGALCVRLKRVNTDLHRRMSESLRIDSPFRGWAMGAARMCLHLGATTSSKLTVSDQAATSIG